MVRHSVFGVVFMVLVLACSSAQPDANNGGGDGGGGFEGGQAAGAGGADPMAGGGSGGGQAAAGAPGGGGSGGTETGTGGRSTLEPPDGVIVDWRACEPGGKCPDNCAERPARATDKPEAFAAKDFRGPVFVPDKDGLIVVEAEALAHSGNWRLVGTNPATTDGSRFTGAGFLVWNGYGVSGIEEDEDQSHQGNRCDWLVVKYWIRPEDEGLYTWEVRTHNVQPDGDNDAWHGRIGQAGSIKRLVTGAGNQQKFTFERAAILLYSPTRLKPGLHAMYIQGRSPGFGIDRIVIRQGGAASLGLARDATRPASKPFPAGYFSQ